jgi:sterol desaturase/sphingolipid hydroxylase (fatty acid hydroxylase superfamily)
MKLEVVVIAAVFVFFAVLEVFNTGLLNKKNEKSGDMFVEIVSGLSLMLLIQPATLLGGALVASSLLPDSQGGLSDLPVLAQFGLFLIFDDLVQYWWHRMAHNVPWLYRLHRAHHNAEYLSVRVVYRNSLLYYVLFPGLWLSGGLIYLGLGWVYAGYAIIKMTVIIAAHSDVHWDAKLYHIKWLSPVMWCVERVISTPSTHSAHHGKHRSDSATHYKGNYGNLLFFWDVLFGTARITRRRPEAYGVENLPEITVSEQLFWPFVRRKKGIKS